MAVPEQKITNAQAFIKYEKEKVEAILRLSVELSKRSSHQLSILGLHERDLHVPPASVDEGLLPEIEQCITDYTSESFGTTDEIIKLLTGRATYDIHQLLLGREDYAQHLILQQNIFGIKSACINDVIFLRLPRLPKRMGRRFRKAEEVFPYEYTDYYPDMIRYALAQALDGWTTDKLLEFAVKTVNYYFVYDEGDKYPCDSDNIDTKLTTDAIVSFFPNGDAATCCDFFYQSVYSSEVESGTIVAITQGENPKVFNSLLPEIKIFGGPKILPKTPQKF